LHICGENNACSLTKNPYLFQGQRLDEETGLYYFKNRYYDPVHGRFISRDPAGMTDGPNLYAFVNNNPINFVDPLGLEMQWFEYSQETYAQVRAIDEADAQRNREQDEQRQKEEMALAAQSAPAIAQAYEAEQLRKLVESMPAAYEAYHNYWAQYEGIDTTGFAAYMESAMGTVKDVGLTARDIVMLGYAGGSLLLAEAGIVEPDTDIHFYSFLAKLDEQVDQLCDDAGGVPGGERVLMKIGLAGVGWADRFTKLPDMFSSDVDKRLEANRAAGSITAEFAMYYAMPKVLGATGKALRWTGRRVIGRLSGRTTTILTRSAKGADGAIARHIVEKVDGRTNSVTHQVIRDGKVIHQHQTYIGKYGIRRQFPDEWSEYPVIEEPKP
jgi:RHS repeat-associated protein